MDTSDPSNPQTQQRVRVTFMPEGKAVEFEYGKLPYQYHGKPMSFLDIAKNHGIVLDHDCGGNCACASCHVWINHGGDRLTPMDREEAARLEKAAGLQLNSRLACQAVITGPGEYVVEVPS